MQSQREAVCECGFFGCGSWIFLRCASDVPSQGGDAGLESGGIVFVLACEGTAEAVAGAVGRWPRRSGVGPAESFFTPDLKSKTKIQIKGCPAKTSCYRWRSFGRRPFFNGRRSGGWWRIFLSRCGGGWCLVRV